MRSCGAISRSCSGSASGRECWETALGARSISCGAARFEVRDLAVGLSHADGVGVDGRFGRALRKNVEGRVVLRVTAGSEACGGEDCFEFAGADDGVDFRDVLLDLVAVALDQAAGDDDALGFSAVLFLVLHHLEDGVDRLLFGGVDEAAGVDDDDLSVFGSGVSSAPLWWSMPIMTSESTRFLGQPSETKPTFGRVSAGISTFTSSRMAGGVTDFYSINVSEQNSAQPRTNPCNSGFLRDRRSELRFIFGQVPLRLAVGCQAGQGDFRPRSCSWRVSRRQRQRARGVRHC